MQNSFNAITVDSDTSTSDTLLLFATGKGAHHPTIAKAADRRLNDFRTKLDALLLDLALQVVRDGEGAQKLIRVDVSGAESDAAAKRIALSIANSPLVKTAIAGADANWGRVVMAVGKSGEAADRDKLKISFGHQVVAEKGERALKYNEDAATRGRLRPQRRDRRRSGIGQGRGARLDLRPDARLHRHQWFLQKLALVAFKPTQQNSLSWPANAGHSWVPHVVAKYALRYFFSGSASATWVARIRGP